MNKIKETLNEALTSLAILRENKGDLGESARFTLYRYFEGQKLGLQLAICEMQDIKKKARQLLDDTMSGGCDREMVLKQFDNIFANCTKDEEVDN